VAIVVLVVALAAGKSRPASPASGGKPGGVVETSADVHVTIQNYAFSPAKLTVKVGTKIIVTNKDQTAHTLTAQSGAFDSGTIQPNKTMSFTVKKAGVYPFYCQFHAFMTGTMTVIK
jgi:plastocyanin